MLILALVGLLWAITPAWAADSEHSELLRLADATLLDGEWHVAVHVLNDQELAGLDIPLQYGQPDDPIDLLRVEFGERVEDWDLTHARIDNGSKTVIMGLIAELVGARTNADLKVSAEGDSRVATLVFRMDDGYDPRFETFETKSPGHSLTFLYNRFEGSVPHVAEIEPRFEVDLDFDKATLPTEYALSQNYPNPFNPSTSFTLSLPEASDYTIRVFNVAGQLVKSLDGRQEAGIHEIHWDGRNNQGSQVASGAYFYRAEASGFSETRKMMLLK